VVLVARHALLFLVAWEVMTLSRTCSSHRITARRGAPRRLGYLVASHVAVARPDGALPRLGRGSLDFAAFPAGGRPGSCRSPSSASASRPAPSGAHVWLPEGARRAPSHVSALMSGSLVTLGVYGLRVRGARPCRRRLRRGAHGPRRRRRAPRIALAWCSATSSASSPIRRSRTWAVLLGLGLGFWSRAHGEPRVAALAFAAALLHVWNHAAMKGLLFLSPARVHATGTRDLERTGGLLRRMPWSGGTMLVGAVAIAVCRRSPASAASGCSTWR
jgi:hypothetical protein